MIIEAGFGLCAANLPTLYGMVRTKGLQTLIHSVRSLVSLGSGFRSNVSDHGDKLQRFRSGEEQGSESHIVLREGSAEAKRSASDYEFSDMGSRGHIRVTKDINVAGDMA